MRILLFGGSGQLGHELSVRARDLHFDIAAPVLSEVDISEPEQVRYLAKKLHPTVIVNCAAYTAVDQAESEREAAFLINSQGAAHVARVARELKIRCIHISTDYVFDGTGNVPFSENDEPRPINVYGESKLAGEKQVLEFADSLALVVRTSSLHGQRGMNFVHTMLDLFQTRDVVKVVNDQFMSPTWAGWLAEVLLDLGRLNVSGILHACGTGVVSWFDFAREILAVVREDPERASKFEKVRIEPTSAADFGRPAKRPTYSALDTTKLSEVLGRKPITWQQGLRGHLRDLGYKVDAGY